MGQAPKGYDEIGESLARCVAEGFQRQAWANELAALAGYNAGHARAWTAWYRSQNAALLARDERRRAQKKRQIQRRQELAEEIRNPKT